MTGAKISLRKPHVITRDGIEVGRICSGIQMRALFALMAQPLVTREQMMEVMWPDPDEMPDWCFSNIGAQLCKLRKNLRPAGWDIRARYGRGWVLVASA